MLQLYTTNGARRTREKMKSYPKDFNMVIYRKFMKTYEKTIGIIVKIWNKPIYILFKT